MCVLFRRRCYQVKRKVLWISVLGTASLLLFSAGAAGRETADAIDIQKVTGETIEDTQADAPQTETDAQEAAGVDAAGTEHLSTEEIRLLTTFADMAYRYHVSFVDVENSEFSNSDLSVYDKAFLLNWYQARWDDERIIREDGVNRAAISDLKDIVAELFGGQDQEAADLYVMYYSIRDDGTNCEMNQKLNSDDTLVFYFQPGEAKTTVSDEVKTVITGEILEKEGSGDEFSEAGTYEVQFVKNEPADNWLFDALKVSTGENGGSSSENGEDAISGTAVTNTGETGTDTPEDGNSTDPDSGTGTGSGRQTSGNSAVSGNSIADASGRRTDGVYDEDGNFFPDDGLGWYDSLGNYYLANGSGWYDADGNYYSNEPEGWTDPFGHFHEGGGSGYYDANGFYFLTDGSGWYDTDGNFNLSDGSGWYDTYGNFYPLEKASQGGALGMYDAAGLVQNYYASLYGYVPGYSNVYENSDGTWTVQLYNFIPDEYGGHTETAAWYVVDSYGYATDWMTGAYIYIGY